MGGVLARVSLASVTANFSLSPRTRARLRAFCVIPQIMRRRVGLVRDRRQAGFGAREAYAT